MYTGFRDDNGNAVRVKQENYNVFKTKNGRKVFDGGGVFPDEALEVTKNTAITDAILNSQSIFDFATTYYYNNKIEDISKFKLTDTDFNTFKNYLNTSGFEFETETEKALKKAMEVSKSENLDDDISKDYKTLITNLDNSKAKAVENNKKQLINLLTDEIVKRYVYREGLYEYYKTHIKFLVYLMLVYNHEAFIFINIIKHNIRFFAKRINTWCVF